MGAAETIIVGPNGFLAKNLTQILPQDEIVIGLAHSSSGRQENQRLHSVYSDLDLLQQEHQNVQYIYILGAYVPYGALDVPSMEFIRSNIQLIAELCLRYPLSRIIFSSSVSVYGSTSESPITEYSAFKSPSLYGMSKLAGEAIVRNHPSYAIIRYTSIVGRGMTQSTFIPRLISQAKTGGKIILKGNGGRMQNYISVQDAATFCFRGARMEGNELLLGVDHQSYSNVEVAEMVKSRLPSGIIFEGEDPSGSLFYDAKRTYALLGYSPQLSLEESIAEMIA